MSAPRANLSPAAPSRAQLTSSGLLPRSPRELLLLSSRRVLHPPAAHGAAPRARHSGTEAATGALWCPRRRTAAPPSHAEVRDGGEPRQRRTRCHRAPQGEAASAPTELSAPHRASRVRTAPGAARTGGGSPRSSWSTVKSGQMPGRQPSGD